MKRTLLIILALVSAQVYAQDIQYPQDTQNVGLTPQATQTTEAPAEVTPPEDRPQVEYNQRGVASWYGKRFHGRKTASGERFNMFEMSAAHKTLPLLSLLHVRNPANGKEITVRVNDRGPYVRGRELDLSYAAAQRLGIHGVALVEFEAVTPSDLLALR